MTDPGTTRRTPVSVADLLRVADVLRADAETLRLAAGMLGLAAPEPVRQPIGVDQPLLPRSPSIPHRSPASQPTEVPDEGAATVRPGGDDPRQARRTRLLRTDRGQATPPRPLRGAVTDLLPAIPVRTAGPQPLFEPAHQRAVLAALAATERPGREVDLDALVARAAAREPLGELAWLTESTTRLGVRLVVDHGPAMLPFRRDLRLLASALRLAVGADAVEVLVVRGDPSRVSPLAGEGEGVPFASVLGARPILLASDLGIGATAAGVELVRPAEWLAADRAARQAGCPLVVLVPYPSARWPRWAVGRLTMVTWDRPTDVRRARRAARAATRAWTRVARR